MIHTMSEFRYQIRQCGREDCGLRYPMLEEQTSGVRCPRCGAPAKLVDTPYVRYQRTCKEIEPGGPEVEALLDNLRSSFNVGSIFRTADAAGIRHIHLCGITPNPANPKVAKTALGAERAVPWTRHGDGPAAAVSLKERGLRLWALESGPRSESLFEAVRDAHGPPIVLAVGNEVFGVDPDILEQCDRMVCIPMQGSKTSLNVAVAFGMAAYVLRYVLLDRSFWKPEITEVDSSTA